MGKLDIAQDRALELIGELGNGIRKAVPGKAMQWVETGAALGAIRTGGKVAGKFVRRNPVLAGVLKTMGFVQRFGFGIAEARRAMAHNGNPPPEFQAEATIVLATLRQVA